MKHWLIVYNRSDSRLLMCDEYDDSQQALRHRFEWEKFFEPCPEDVEVVVLGADSLEMIQKTHARYFAGTPDIAAVSCYWAAPADLVKEC